MIVKPTPEPQLVLLRHGQTEWSASGRHTGRTDIPLTHDGKLQARHAGLALQELNFRSVFTSPLQRARDTAELAAFGSRATVDENLAEWDYGPVEGRTASEISDHLGREFLIFRDGVHVLPADASQSGRPGERLEDVYHRAQAFVERAEQQLQDGDDVLVVAHGHLLRILATAWLGVDPVMAERFELGTAAICLLGYGHNLRTIQGWNLPPTA
jgi:probable phosphoglycerate mutase